MLIVVAVLVVNFFTKMNIARNPEGFQVPGVVQMNPTGLPELFKPTRDKNVEQKCENMRFDFCLRKSNLRSHVNSRCFFSR